MTSKKELTIRELIKQAHATAVNKGWWEQLDSTDIKCIPEKLALVHSEISEALEAYRADLLYTVFDAGGKPKGFPSELADAVIRIADLCGRFDIDLTRAIRIKMQYNKKRPHRHGGKKC